MGDDNVIEYIVPMRAHFDAEGGVHGLSMASTIDWTAPEGTSKVVTVGGVAYCEDLEGHQGAELWLRPQMVDASDPSVIAMFQTYDLVLTDLVTGDVLRMTRADEVVWTKIPSTLYQHAAAVPFTIELVNRNDPSDVIAHDPKFKLPKLGDAAEPLPSAPQWRLDDAGFVAGDPTTWRWTLDRGHVEGDAGRSFLQPESLPPVSRVGDSVGAAVDIGDADDVKRVATRLINDLLASDPVAGWDQSDSSTKWSFSLDGSRLTLAYQRLAERYLLKANEYLAFSADGSSVTRVSSKEEASELVLVPVDARSLVDGPLGRKGTYPSQTGLWAVRGVDSRGGLLLLDIAEPTNPSGSSVVSRPFAVEEPAVAGEHGGSASQQWALWKHDGSSHFHLTWISNGTIHYINGSSSGLEVDEHSNGLDWTIEPVT